MRDCALRNRGTQRCDLCEPGTRGRVVERVKRVVRNAVEVFVVPAEQFDEQSFLGLEVVVEAACLDAGGISDVVHRGAKS